MTEETIETTKAPSGRDNVVCVCVGKCVGNTYRCVCEKTEALGHYAAKAGESLWSSARMVGARLRNLFKTVKHDGRMAHWEMKQKDDFAELGAAVYRKKDDDLEEVIKDDHVKPILNRLDQSQGVIEEIKTQKNQQQKRMQDLAVYRRAMTQLNSPDPSVRRAGLRVIGRVGDAQVLPKLADLIEDPDEVVRAEASQVFQKLTDKRFGRTRKETKRG
jgi:hypothetical protein